jgi:hypothetical protein
MNREARCSLGSAACTWLGPEAAATARLEGREVAQLEKARWWPEEGEEAHSQRKGMRHVGPTRLVDGGVKPATHRRRAVTLRSFWLER